MNRLNNKGLSYLELVLVIAIMAIVVGFTTISINTVNNNNVSRSADSAYSVINKARNNAMVKGSKYGWITFTNHNNVVYYRIGEKVPYISGGDYYGSYNDWKKLCPASVKMMFGSNSFDNGETCELAFKQSTGECLGIYLPESEALGASVSPVINESILIQMKRSGSTSTTNVKKFRVYEIGGSVVWE